MEDVIIYAELCTLQDELSTLVDDESIILRKRVLVHVLEMDLGKIEWGWDHFKCITLKDWSMYSEYMAFISVLLNVKDKREQLYFCLCNWMLSVSDMVVNIVLVL